MQAVANHSQGQSLFESIMSQHEICLRVRNKCCEIKELLELFKKVDAEEISKSFYFSELNEINVALNTIALFHGTGKKASLHPPKLTLRQYVLEGNFTAKIVTGKGKTYVIESLHRKKYAKKNEADLSNTVDIYLESLSDLYILFYDNVYDWLCEIAEEAKIKVPAKAKLNCYTKSASFNLNIKLLNPNLRFKALQTDVADKYTCTASLNSQERKKFIESTEKLIQYLVDYFDGEVPDVIKHFSKIEENSLKRDIIHKIVNL